MNTKKLVERKGFTLTELLIVMAVVAVLAAVAIPTFSKQMEAARETNDLSLIRNAYTEAMAIAELDITDGKLDGKKNGTAISETNITIDGTDKTAKTYSVDIITMMPGSSWKQTGSTWAYVDNHVGGKEVNPGFMSDKSYKVKFTFALDDNGVLSISSIEPEAPAAP